MAERNLYTRPDGKWAWRLKADNGKIIDTDGGQGYDNEDDARSMADRIIGGEFRGAKKTITRPITPCSGPNLAGARVEPGAKMTCPDIRPRRRRKKDMSYLEQELLSEVRTRRSNARKKVIRAEQMLDEARVEYQELDQAVTTLEGLAKEHDDFNDSAKDILG